MQADKLRELRELLAAATPGPWTATDGHGCIDGPNEGVAQCWVRRNSDLHNINAELIAAAVNALPELLAIAEGAEVRKAIGAAHNRAGPAGESR